MDKSQLKRYGAMREIPTEDANALIEAELLYFSEDIFSENAQKNSTINALRFYDLNALPKHLHEQYDKDNVSGNRPAVEGFAAVWTHDFESWRTFYLTGKPRPFF